MGSALYFVYSLHFPIAKALIFPLPHRNFSQRGVTFIERDSDRSGRSSKRAWRNHN